MSELIKFATINESDSYPQFNVSALEPLDAVRVVLEQAIYADYLMLTGNTETANGLKQQISGMRAALPTHIPGVETSHSALYAAGLEFIAAILSGRYSCGQHVNTLQVLFEQPIIREYVNGEYTAHMTKDFLTQWSAYRYGLYDKSTYTEGTLIGTGIYVPESKVVLNRHPEINRLDNKDFCVVVEFHPRSVISFTLASPEVPKGTFVDFIQRFDFSDRTVEDLVGILASFALEHDRYVMTNSSVTPELRIADVCFDMVTGSSYAPRSAGLRVSSEVHAFFNFLKEAVQTNRLAGVKDHGLFGELLSRCGEDPNIVNYFAKPVTLISSAEAFAFRKSAYATFIEDRFVSGMEAVDENAETDEGSEGDSSEDKADDTKDTDEQSSDEKDSDDDSSAETTDTDPEKVPEELKEDESTSDDDDADKKKTDKKPTIDPQKMLIELASPDETMSEYIFRETVARRISDILRNPPENARPNDLLMLKRWRSRWLYLASISCLRDFLTRVSIRLSDAT